MAPPRATKISSLTSVSQATTRRGLQQVRRQIVEEVEDLDSFDDPSALEIDDSEEQEPAESHATNDGPLEQLLADMVDGQRKRHTKRKEAVNKEYDTSYKTAQDSIRAVFDAHEEKASSAHEAQLKRLQELLGQKAQIEAAMSDMLASLRADYNAHSRDLEAVINRRTKELK
ncbi:uncharacterized protein K460DRAFT_430757 [Cucurbitaria berberidis CBS 394.84]|uniref:Uncharacterized protein n=1 Tax=Cucurbitaria berberidis CBS 394.84 TaxID=1168544 RepID=A0A9P4GI33_9PLEO|nr:uncharacterized protein K460DRAFT_430757 [Cucurbitaria berberidis CBS 394.84]KAF1845821.1 hypothetical protein K460DRAFT_430757 [Cucurbitaria berberidis CBS 394.84]